MKIAKTLPAGISKMREDIAGIPDAGGGISPSSPLPDAANSRIQRIRKRIQKDYSIKKDELQCSPENFFAF